MSIPSISVLMPTYKQAYFIARAIASLQAQTLPNWELIIVEDGSSDTTYQVIELFLSDARIQYHRLKQNRGLGFALNYALSLAQTPLIAYLPSDDVYYADHLQTLLNRLEQTPEAILCYSGVRYNYNRSTSDEVPGTSLQLVQVLHCLTSDRWMERDELVTDDLERMFWSKLRSQGVFVGTQRVSCEWVAHPRQRHKILQEPVGGINTYRSYYGVQQPLRFHTTAGNFLDEVAHYRQFRERPATPPARDGLRILLVGELAYNPERILALEERGHQLYGLWMQDPYWYNTVGPVPFGHVQDIPIGNWQAAVRDIQPDIIYALLNWQAVPFAHKVLSENLGIPFVWHFKEGPFICLEKGMWEQLIDLYLHADGQIYSSPEMRDWFTTVVPGLVEHGQSYVLDGDLPKADWFENASPLYTERPTRPAGGLHTVVPGRPIGLHPPVVEELAKYDIHLHFYGDFVQNQWPHWIQTVRSVAPNHLHLHKQVDQEHWVSEFAHYDAGWLHFFKSENEGDLRRANWDDLNYPARLATLAVAGLPLLQYDNSGSIVATQSIVRNLDIGIFFNSVKHLREQLEDEPRVNLLKANVRAKRAMFTFDYHVESLVEFFRQVISKRQEEILRDPCPPSGTV